MNLENVTGMVLSAMPIGEYDKRLLILTKEKGKISAFVKGARRPNSMYLGCSQPFVFGEFTLYQGRNSYTVNGAEIKNYFDELKLDLDKVMYASYFCELSAFLSYENVEAYDLLKLLYQSFKALNHEKIPKELIRAVFELKALVYNGQMPQVFSCVKCGKKMEQEQVWDSGFSCVQGGMVCPDCKGAVKGLQEITPSVLYTLQYIVSSPVEKLYTFVLEEETLASVIKIVKQYMGYYADGTFRSLEMIDGIEGK